MEDNIATVANGKLEGANLSARVLRCSWRQVFCGSQDVRASNVNPGINLCWFMEYLELNF